MARKTETKDSVVVPDEVFVDPIAEAPAADPPVVAAPAVLDAPPVVATPAPAAEPDIRLTVMQYTKLRGFRPHRAMGFHHEMSKKFPGPRTRPEWDSLWDAFNARSV